MNKKGKNGPIWPLIVVLILGVFVIVAVYIEAESTPLIG